MIKKYLLLFVIAIFVMSCSKKVEVKGKIAGSAPLERIEFVEASGVATLPLVNLGLDKDGNFAGTFEAPKNGMYVINYAGKQNLIFLKGGQTLNISGSAATFPNEYVVTGDAKNDNDFFQASQKFLSNYGQTLNIQELMAGDEAKFVKGMQKIEADINKNSEENVKKYNPGKEVIEWKKSDAKVVILNLMVGYEMTKKQTSGNPAFKLAKVFTDYENKLKENNLKSKLIVQVHDEILVETLESEKEQVKQIVKEEMENVIKLKVPLLAEVEEGQNWYEAK